MAKKWSDPLDRLLEADEKSRSVSDILKTLSENTSSPSVIPQDELMLRRNYIQEIDVNDIIRWEYKDRPENELGNIDELAETFKQVGQQQPCILRPSKNIKNKFELIVGERRWKAAEKAQLKLKAIIQEIDDKTAALIQAIENEKRSDLSEFAKGISYANKIEQGLLTQKDLIEILGISKQQVTRLLSYKKIPESLFNAIGDFRLISARTAYELARLSVKSDLHLRILIELADKIREGKYGQKRIEKELENRISKNKPFLIINKKILSEDGKHLFTWRLDNNSIPSIHFPQDILKLIHDNVINFESITQELKECISNKINDTKK